MKKIFRISQKNIVRRWAVFSQKNAFPDTCNFFEFVNRGIPDFYSKFIFLPLQLLINSMNMKKTILTLAFLFLQMALFAQTWEQLNNQAFALNRQKKYDEAVKTGLKALEMAKTNFGTNHIKYAASLSNVANLHKDHNNRRYHAKADFYYKEAFKFFVDHPQEQNHNIEAALNMGYGLYSEMMKYPDAKKYFQRAYEIYKRNMGENHGLTQNAKKKL